MDLSHMYWYNDFVKYKYMDVEIFSDKIYTGMKLRYSKYLLVSTRNTEMNGGTYLVYIRNSQCETTKKRKRGAVEAGHQQTCWMCLLRKTSKNSTSVHPTCARSVIRHCASLSLCGMGD